MRVPTGVDGGLSRRTPRRTLSRSVGGSLEAPMERPSSCYRLDVVLVVACPPSLSCLAFRCKLDVSYNPLDKATRHHTGFVR